MSRVRITPRVYPAPRCRTGWPAGTAVRSASIALAGRLLVLLCALGAASAAFAADEIHWTLTGQTSVTFDWRGTSAEDTLHYGTSPGVYTGTVLAAPPSPLPFSSSGPFWEARLTGLQEDTLYYYAIGNGPEHTFRTPPPRGDSHFTVYAVGDIGSTNSSSRVAAVQDLITNGLPGFAFPVGDLTYGDLHGQDDVDQHFNDVMGWSREAAYMPAWGNHEWATGDDLRNYKGRFDLPNPQTSPGSPAVSCCGEDWYWFDYGNVRFIAYPEPWTGAWTDWNTKATTLMAAAQADPAISFIVTFGHRPAYSSGGIAGSATLQGFLDALGNVYSKYVLNVAGHSHNYERTFPQHGVVHVVVGTGGESQATLGSPQPFSAFRALHFGALRVHFTPTGIEGAFICGPASSVDTVTCTVGSVVDSFTIGTVGSDLSPPAVKITAPGSGATVFGTTAVTALAADNVGVVGVQFRLDGNPLAAEATTAPYAVAWDTTTATAGAHVLTAVARDAAGNTATSPQVPVIVNNDVTTLTFPPSADATIQFDLPTTNSGAATSLQVDGSPVKDFLMKFPVSGVGTRPVLAARLRLRVVDASDRGGDFHRVADSTWSEQTVTWNTAPAADPAVLASLGAVSAGTWVDVDLTTLITGDGEFSLRVMSPSSNGADYSSREAAGFAPQLLVTVANQGSNQAPNGVIDTPTGNVTIQAGQSVSFTGTGTDPDGNTPLTFLWDFGGGANSSTLEDPGAITFSTVGTYTVTFTVTDSQGLADPTPATRVVTVTASNQAPNGVIDTPTGNVTIQAGQSVSFTGTGTDPDGNLPLTFLWDFGGGATPNTSTLEDPGAITFPAAGTYTVTFTVTDSQGLADPTPATRVITVTGPLPAAPTNLTATGVSTSQINLAWTDNASNEVGFKIERCAGAGCADFVQIATVGANVTTFSNTGLAASTYSYRVRAYNATGDSGYSNTASAATLPAAPSGLTATAVSSSQVNLVWTDNAATEVGFKIERCAGSGCTFQEIPATVGANVTSYTDPGLAASTTYSYRVRAYNGSGNSGYSSTASVRVIAAPSNLTATAVSSSQITLTWTDNANNDKGFKIERCQGAGCTNFVQIATVGANKTQYDNTGLTAATTYTYRVRAYHTNSNSDYSNTASAATP